MTKEKFESLREHNDFIIEHPKNQQGYFGSVLGIGITIDEYAVDGFEVVYKELE